MERYGLQQRLLQDYMAFEETANAASWPGAGGVGGPLTNQAYLYCKDKSSVSNLYWKNDAGTEYDMGLLTAAAGVANRVAIWTSATALGSDADLTFVTDTLTATKIVAPTSVTISTLTLGSIVFAGTAGLLSQDNANLFWDDTNNRLGLGIAASLLAALHIQVTGNEPLTIDGYGSGQSNNIRGRHANGTAGSPTQLVVDDACIMMSGLGYHSGGAFSSAQTRVGLMVAESWTNTNRGSYINFWTTPLLSTTMTERFRVGPSGQWGIGGATYGSSLDVYTSGGSAGAPSWTAPGALTKTDDTNVTLTLGGTPTTALLRAASLTLGWTGQLSVARGGTGLSSISGDWLSQYFLLAGRSGGQNAIAGTAAGDDCGVYATSNATPTTGTNGSGAVVNIGVNSGATHPIATAYLEDANTGVFRMKSPGSSKQLNLEWADGNTRKWALYKLTTHELALFDDAGGQTIITFSPASASPQFLIRAHPSWAPTTANSVCFLLDPIFTGSANGAQGFNASPEFNCSADMAASYANLSINVSNPQSTKTIAQAVGAYYRNDYKSSVGAITLGINCLAAGVVITGSVKPASQFGVYCANQGAAGIGLAANLYIDPCSGATNSFDIGFGGSDGTAVGAYFGRIPILYAGLLKYLAVYS